MRQSRRLHIKPAPLATAKAWKEAAGALSWLASQYSKTDPHFTRILAAAAGIVEVEAVKHLGTESNTNTVATPESDRLKRDFFAAYARLNGEVGRGFILIHQIRSLLQWPRQQFDALLHSLLVEDVVEGQQGNPPQMTPQQINDSYIDPHGRLLTCCTWWGQPA